MASTAQEEKLSTEIKVRGYLLGVLYNGPTVLEREILYLPRRAVIGERDNAWDNTNESPNHNSKFQETVSIVWGSYRFFSWLK